jgi:hypothetical protein
MKTWSSQTVTDQLTSMLAERRRESRDRRAAYLNLARAIVHGDWELYEQQPTPIGDRRIHAA